MIKILQLANKLPYPPKDGGAVAVLNMAKGLKNEGCEISLLCFNTSKHYFDVDKLKNVDLPYKLVRAVDLDTTVSLIRAFTNLFIAKNPYHVKRFYSKKFKTKLIDLLKLNDFDFIQIESLYLLQYVNTIREYSNSKIIYRAHNIEHEIWLRKAEKETSFYLRRLLFLFSAKIRKYEFQIFQKCDLLMTISNKDLSLFQQNSLNIPYHTASVGIELDEIVYNNKSNDLFFIGALDWIPNIDGLFWFLDNCFNEIVRLFPNICFHVAGRNASDLVKEKLFEIKNLVFHGEIDCAKRFISDHTILLVPLFSGSGMRVKIAEGMSFGKVIVTTTIGLEGIEAKDEIEIIIANSTEEWIGKIKLLLDDKGLRLKIAMASRIFAENNFALPRISKKVINFFKQNQ